MIFHSLSGISINYLGTRIIPASHIVVEGIKLAEVV